MALIDMQAELTIVMGELTEICKRHGYDASPMVLLAHADGPSASVLVGNVNPYFACEVIRVLGNSGRESDMSVHEAAVRAFTGHNVQGSPGRMKKRK